MQKGALWFKGRRRIRLPFPLWIAVGSRGLVLSTMHVVQIGNLLEVKYCFLRGGLWSRRRWWHRSRWIVRRPPT